MAEPKYARKKAFAQSLDNPVIKEMKDFYQELGNAEPSDVEEKVQNKINDIKDRVLALPEEAKNLIVSQFNKLTANERPEFEGQESFKALLGSFTKALDNIAQALKIKPSPIPETPQTSPTEPKNTTPETKPISPTIPKMTRSQSTLDRLKENVANLFKLDSKSETTPAMTDQMQKEEGMKRIPLIHAFMEKAQNVKQRLEANPKTDVSSDLEDLQSMRNQMLVLEKQGRENRQIDWKITQHAGLDMSSSIASIKCLAGDSNALDFREQVYQDYKKEKIPSISDDFNTRMSMLTEKIEKMAEHDHQSSAKLGPR